MHHNKMFVVPIFCLLALLSATVIAQGVPDGKKGNQNSPSNITSPATTVVSAPAAPTVVPIQPVIKKVEERVSVDAIKSVPLFVSLIVISAILFFIYLAISKINAKARREVLYESQDNWSKLAKWYYLLEQQVWYAWLVDNIIIVLSFIGMVLMFHVSTVTKFIISLITSTASDQMIYFDSPAFKIIESNPWIFSFLWMIPIFICINAHIRVMYHWRSFRSLKALNSFLAYSEITSLAICIFYVYAGASNLLSLSTTHGDSALRLLNIFGVGPEAGFMALDALLILTILSYFPYLKSRFEAKGLDDMLVSLKRGLEYDPSLSLEDMSEDITKRSDQFLTRYNAIAEKLPRKERLELMSGKLHNVANSMKQFYGGRGGGGHHNKKHQQPVVETDTTTVQQPPQDSPSITSTKE